MLTKELGLAWLDNNAEIISRKDGHIIEKLIIAQEKQANMEPIRIIHAPIKKELSQKPPLPAIQSLLCAALIMGYVGDKDAVLHLLQ